MTTEIRCVSIVAKNIPADTDIEAILAAIEARTGIEIEYFDHYIEVTPDDYVDGETTYSFRGNYKPVELIYKNKVKLRE